MESRLLVAGSESMLDGASGISESRWTTYLRDDHNFPPGLLSNYFNSIEQRGAIDISDHLVDREDSNSMASDASSGPQTILDEQAVERMDVDDDEESSLTGGGNHKQRPEPGAGQAHDPRDPISSLKDTAIADADAVGTRLKFLQSLLPDGAKICREDVVGAALEYIRCLEQRKKVLESYVADIDIGDR